MTTPSSFFVFDNGVYTPTDLAQSAWSDDMINGPAVVGALARELESDHGVEGFQPARLTVDLFAPVRMTPLRVRTEAVREGRRIRVADAHIVQGDDDTPVARASFVQLRRGEQPPGEIWHSDRVIEVPPQHAVDELGPFEFPVFDSDSSQQRWTTTMGAHQGPGRKRYWHHPLDVVDVEIGTPFQKAAVLAETTSLMTNWGSEGIGFINTDLTLSLSRLPVSNDLGIEADNHISHDGVGIGTATLFDREGVFGVGTVVALSNAKRQIDFGGQANLRPSEVRAKPTTS